MSAAIAPRGVVLIADDDELMRVMLSEAVEQAGLSVIAVSDGQSALNAGLHTDFAMALLDVEMPGLDGYELCRALRTRPNACTLPIIMITGRDDAESVAKAFNAGATDFIPKPLNWPLMPHRLQYIQRNAELMRSLQQRESENSALIASIPDTIYIVTADELVQRAWNDPELADSAALPVHIGTVLAPGVATRAARSIRATATDGCPRNDEYTIQDAGSEERSYNLRYFRCSTSEVLVVRQDVTARKSVERRIVQLAFHDSLTGLPNRESFIDMVRAELAEPNVAQDGLAVVCFNLVGFERISETFGHAVGDEVLRTSAAQLTAALVDLRTNNSRLELARLEGGKFVVLIRAQQAVTVAESFAQSLTNMFREPVRCGQQNFFVAPSMGVASYPLHGRDADELFKNANTAMFQAKEPASGGYVRYAEVMSARALEWLSLDAELRRAVANDALELHFQPKFRLLDGALVGVEALLRWCHPRLGQIPPPRFIALAEETGLILDVGAWVTRAACRQLQQWNRLGLHTSIAINFSGKEFLHGSPARLVERESAAAGLAPGSLEIEITESVLVTDFTRISSGLAALKELGCRIALDDFGTGYSSLAYLQKLPLDTLKVDRTFITDVHRQRADGAIFDAIVGLARSIGLTVLAEGVEQAAQLEWLKLHGCDVVQGYLLGRPMPAADIELLLMSVDRDAASEVKQRCHPR